jgi:hypothetical protein
MDPVHGIGVAAFLALGAGFLASGDRLSAFLRLAASIVVVWVITGSLLIDAAGARGSLALISAGLLLFGVGLAIVRLMTIRSVTLHFLSRLPQTAAVASMQAEISGRVAELTQLGLARRAGDRLLPTSRGRLIGSVAGGLYRAFRLPG